MSIYKKDYDNYIDGNSASPERDEEGYLVDPVDWSPELAEIFAAEENIQLSKLLWQIIGFIRQYYTDHQIAPDVRHITLLLASAKGINKKAAKQMLFGLFPYGYVKQACKIAGMKKPRAWSTG